MLWKTDDDDDDDDDDDGGGGGGGGDGDDQDSDDPPHLSQWLPSRLLASHSSPSSSSKSLSHKWE